MKSQMQHQPQPDQQQWQEARRLLDAEAVAFDEWLDSQEGKSWLETEEEKAGSWWNHDGFNTEVCGHA